MSGFQVMISEAARQDLQEIMSSIKNLKDPVRIQESTNKLETVVSSLGEEPFRRPLVNDEKLVTAGIRKLKVDEYIIFFVASEKEKTVSTVRILRDQRHWANLI